MRRSLLSTAILLSLAAHAAAQTRIAVTEAGSSGIAAPAGPFGASAISPVSLTLSAPSLTGGLTPSLAPSLSALSVSPAVHAASIEAPDPEIRAAAKTEAKPAANFALSAAARPAAAKADDIRAEVAKAIEEWKAGRSQAAGAKTPAASASVEAAADLDALFDGSLPTSREVLARASGRGLGEAALGLAISESADASEAALRLQALGVLGPKEAALAASDEDGFRFLLTRVWRKSAASVPSAIPVDSSWSVPALKVVRDGVVYFVHGVTHGQYGPPRRGAVLKLARAVAKSGGALYSEQNLPAYYGYANGKETLDHASANGAPAAVVPAAGGQGAAVVLLQRAINWAVAPGGALAALAWTLLHPAAPLAWAALSALTGLAWLVLTGGLPLMRLRRRRRAAAARAAGLEDMADQFADEARDFFVAKPDLEILRGLELPQPLGAQPGDPYSARSRAIADAVAADAAASGAKTVHLVAGHLHAHEIAWRLAHPVERKS